MDSPEATEEYNIGGKIYTGIYLSAIYDEIGKDYARQTGKILSALGLKTDRPRITKSGKGKDGEPQEYTKRYSMVRIPDEKKKTELRSRYDPDFVIAKLSSIEQGQQTILDDEDDEDDEKGRGTHNFNGKGDNGPEFSKPSEQKKSSDSKDNLQSSKTFRDNKDIEKENYSENNTNKNNKATLEINAQESNEDKKTDTPLKNDSPHRPLRPDLQEDHVNSYAQSNKPYKSVDIVLRALKDWGLEVLEYDHLLLEQGKWKAKIKGRFDSLTKEQQEFLSAGFELHFKGSPSADFTWVHFEVVAQ
jgi:hypothetical protein